MNEYMNLLGKKAKDKVTGFTGVVTTVSFDLYGCVQVVVNPEAGRDGKLETGHWFDAKRIITLSAKPVMDVPNFAAIPAGREPGPAHKPAQSTVAR